jgi:nicotinic acid mononucleotide adenylyltransferase
MPVQTRSQTKAFTALNTVNKNKTCIFTIGRMNPFTAGHLHLIRVMQRLPHSSTTSYRLYLTTSVDDYKNPLKIDEKVKLIQTILDRHHVNGLQIIPISHVNEIDFSEFNHTILVVGQDRRNAYRSLFAKTKIMNIPRTNISSTQIREMAFTDFCAHYEQLGLTRQEVDKLYLKINKYQ